MMPVTIDYTNWRGERRMRKIEPRDIEFRASPPFHPTPTWIMRAIDLDKGEARDFAMDMIHNWRTIGDRK